MAIESVKTRLAAMQLSTNEERELRAVLAALVDAVQNIATKLDADAGVSATDFVSTTAAIITD